MKRAYRHKGLSEKPQETRPFIMTVNYQDTSVPQEIGYVAGTFALADKNLEAQMIINSLDK